LFRFATYVKKIPIIQSRWALTIDWLVVLTSKLFNLPLINVAWILKFNSISFCCFGNFTHKTSLNEKKNWTLKQNKVFFKLFGTKSLCERTFFLFNLLIQFVQYVFFAGVGDARFLLIFFTMDVILLISIIYPIKTSKYWKIGFTFNQNLSKSI
jgi:hypothetical protein